MDPLKTRQVGYYTQLELLNGIKASSSCNLMQQLLQGWFSGQNDGFVEWFLGQEVSVLIDNLQMIVTSGTGTTTLQRKMRITGVR